jgi:hypothetical protein
MAHIEESKSATGSMCVELVYRFRAGTLDVKVCRQLRR